MKELFPGKDSGSTKAIGYDRNLVEEVLVTHTFIHIRGHSFVVTADQSIVLREILSSFLLLQKIKLKLNLV